MGVKIDLSKENMNMKKILIILFVFLLLITGCNNGDTTNKNKMVLSLEDFHGRWRGEIVSDNGPLVFKDTWILNIDSSQSTVFRSSATWNYEFFPIEWKIVNNLLILYSEYETNRLVLSLKNPDINGVVKGILTQYDMNNEVTFTKISEHPRTGEFMIDLPRTPYNDRIKQLNYFLEYKDDGTSIPFHYDLNRRDLYQDLIDEYDLDEITAGLTDVELMIVLLNWVCDNFRHNGGSNISEDLDAISIISFYKENPGGISCRMLAILLAELYRLYGIEAKHITGYPPERPSHNHVVTHAYSKELNQWIMFDPTFRLYLTDKDGNYMNLATLRESFTFDDIINMNENAAHNNRRFSVKDYKEFMVEYLFLFSCATDFTFGSENQKDGNISNVLVPVGFKDHTDGLTTSADAFWALPKQGGE